MSLFSLLSTNQETGNNINSNFSSNTSSANRYRYNSNSSSLEQSQNSQNRLQEAGTNDSSTLISSPISPCKKALIIACNATKSECLWSPDDLEELGIAYKLYLNFEVDILGKDLSTKVKFLKKIDDLTSEADKGDVLIIHYLGSSNGEKLMIFHDESFITRDEFVNVTIEPLQLGVSLFVVLDSNPIPANLIGFRYLFTDSDEVKSILETKAIPIEREENIVVFQNQTNTVSKRKYPDFELISSNMKSDKDIIKKLENKYLAETQTSVVIVCMEHSTLYRKDKVYTCVPYGILSWIFTCVLKNYYTHHVTFANLLIKLKAALIANNITFCEPRIYCGQFLDPQIPIGRYLSAPI